jgi:OOP family OmpA-OmpF porin
MTVWTRSLLVLALCAVFSVPAFSETGTVEMEITSVGVGFGFGWGRGTFNIDGRDVPFTMLGYRVTDVGVMVSRVTGTVSNIEDVRNLEGTYTARSASGALLAGGTRINLVNDAGVKISLSGASYGLGASLAAEGGEIELGDIPEPPAVAAAPPPKPEVVEPPPPDPCEETVTFPGVLFEFDESDLTPAGEGAIGAIAARLMECQEEQVVVDGYTDDLGSDAYNEALSQRRAEAVQFALSQSGVSLERMTAVGHGKKNPVAPNDTDEGRAQNRRAEISTP